MLCIGVGVADRVEGAEAGAAERGVEGGAEGGEHAGVHAGGQRVDRVRVQDPPASTGRPAPQRYIHSTVRDERHVTLVVCVSIKATLSFNKTRTSKVGAISKAQKAQKIFLEKNL